MLTDPTLQRVPPREPPLRTAGEAGEAPPGSVEYLLGASLHGPVSPLEPDARQRTLLTALEGALDRGLAGDSAALLDVHRSAYAVYETVLGHPLGVGARHERSAWFNAFRWTYEDRVLGADTADIADQLPDARDAARPEFVRSWFLSAAKERSALDVRVETYLAEEASTEQLARFVQVDGYLNYRFYDALVMAQLHFMESVKHEISKHMWDEAGEGEALLAHTVQFTRSLRRMDLELPVVPLWEDWRPYAGHNLYFLLGCNRRHHFKALGSLAMPELFDVDRDTAVIRGLERHGYSAEKDFEFFHNHVEGDAEHGPQWLDGVVLPIVESEPEAGMELIVGGALRMLAMRRYNEYLAGLLGLPDPDAARAPAEAGGAGEPGDRREGV